MKLQVLISGNLKSMKHKKKSPKKTPSKTRKNLNPQLDRLSEEAAKEKAAKKDVKEAKNQAGATVEQERNLSPLPLPRRISGRPATKVI